MNCITRAGSPSFRFHAGSNNRALPRVQPTSYVNERQAHELWRPLTLGVSGLNCVQERRGPKGRDFCKAANFYLNGNWELTELGSSRKIGSPQIDEAYLEDRLTALEAARIWSPRVASRLEALIRSVEESSLFRVNPIKFAHERNINESEAIDLFLHATAVGIFTMDWMVLCPLCSAIVESFGSLRTINSNHYHCHFCQADHDVTLDDYIIIAFTIAPRIRPIAFHQPETLSPMDYLSHVTFSGPHLQCDVPRGAACLSPQQIFEQCIRGCDFLGPNETTTFECVTGQSGESTLNGTEAKSGRHFMVTVGAPPTNQVQHLSVDFVEGAWTSSLGKVAIGPVQLVVRNSSDHRIFVTVVEFPNAAPHCCSVLDFEPHLTAKRLLTTQTFRDLFRAEQIKGTEGIGVRDITLVFTDLKGSTELYERIGDLNALALVQQHFERLTDVTVRHNGAIIKTLGDAVMAAFMEPADAVKAALAMRSEIARFNAARMEPDLILKVGLHRGAAIAVTFNDRLDYFGQTVNIAARVEALANGDDIYLTREVHDAPEVGAILAPYAVTSASARLKGIHDEMPVWRIHNIDGDGARPSKEMD
jgi:class 3 adenylate cyclase